METVKSQAVRLLMLDDDPEDAFLVKTALQKTHLEWIFDHFQTCKAFNEYLDKDYSVQIQESPMILLLDLNMPSKTGVEWLRELRADRRFDELVIIVFSTSDMCEEKTRTLALGANDHIGKPDSVLELARTLNKLYEQWIK